MNQITHWECYLTLTYQTILMVVCKLHMLCLNLYIIPPSRLHGFSFMVMKALDMDISHNLMIGSSVSLITQPHTLEHLI